MLYGAAQCADGVRGDAIMIAPPLNITEDQVDEIIDLFDRSLGQVFSG